MCKRSALIIAEHSPISYSGGRLHIWMMGEALAAEGVAITVWTNVEPFLARDFTNFPGHEAIDLHIDPGFFNPPEGHYDFVILAPHLRPCWRASMAALLATKRHEAPLIFLDFESPAWFNAESPSHRPFWRTASWWAIARHAHVILSSTRISSSHARRYYQPLMPESAFQVCPPAINSIAADDIVVEKKQQLVCITRLDRFNEHKGAAALLGIFCEAARGYKVILIGTVSEAFKRQMHRAADRFEMIVSFEQGLTDIDKFREIKRSRAMVFLSHFEGFGYPPAEALYCGTPCITYPLQVFKENFGDDLHYIPYGDLSALELALEKVLGNSSVLATGRGRAAELVGFDSYRARLSILAANWTNITNQRKLPRRTFVERLGFKIAGWFISILYSLLRHR